MLRLQTLGHVAVQGDTGAVAGAATQRRRLALLVLLGAAGERGMSRDKALAYLWPESGAERARHTLAQALYAIRREMGEVLVATSTDLRLNSQVISCDTAEFGTALEQGELERAVDLYTGPFLDGFHVGEAPEFERWVDAERSRLERRVHTTLEALATAAAARGDHARAAEWWQRLAAMDPLSSRIALACMTSLAAAGDRAGALQLARAHTALVREELGVEPEAAVAALVKQLRDETAAPVASPPTTQPSSPRQPVQRRGASGVGNGLANRYRIEREIGGHGGPAVTYLAHDLEHDRPVTLKVLRPEVAITLGPRRFLREIKLVARLNHPNVVPLYASGEMQGALFYVMPHVEGETLRDRLRREQRLPLDVAVSIARDVASALAHAHARGVVHRDIRPENILLSEGRAVVADFGVARAIDSATQSVSGERLTGPGSVLGTLPYMSPEQVQGSADLDGRTDVYSLGCVLFEMLTGAVPFSGAAAVSGQGMRATPALSTLEPAVRDAVARALARRPEDRFPGAVEFRDALPRALSS